MLCHLSIFFSIFLLTNAQQVFFPPDMDNSLPFSFPREMISPSSISGKDTSTSTEDRVTGRKLGELIHDMSKELYLTINNPFQFQKGYLPSEHLPNHFSPYSQVTPSPYFSGMGAPFAPGFPYGLNPQSSYPSFPPFQPPPFPMYQPFPIV